MILAFHVGDFAAVAIIVVIIGCTIGGMVKFSKAIKVLKKGPPEGDPEIAAEQEKEFQNHEQDD
ncbi:MAG: hypothetical protein L7U83_15270 [Akkermansiaceae bacterium]|jgi:hypothetical protein|nr:hypothetical protein [Akkermansiaceae bacterium]HBF16008.1 hypothetical protein [Verrucomicrobiales bacterium]|tara:strand:+ start:243 stop:434 length:192 start_codon:yes stop_codon:yes gene_type:complete